MPPEAPTDDESTADYCRRKGEELALLHRFLGEPPPPTPRTVGEIVAAKQRLRAELLAFVARRQPTLAESNLGPRVVPLGPGRLRWEYQRYDLQYRRRPFHAVAYPLPGVACASFGLLTGSGMAAVSTTLGALDSLAEPGAHLLLDDDAYFETLFYVHRHLDRLKIDLAPHRAPFGGSVLFLDSFSARDRFAALAERSFARLRAVVLDTTCYDGADPRIAALVEKCTAQGVLCVLVRSHLKLDQLGLEYHRLGSVVLLLPRRPTRPLVAFAKQLRARMGSRLAVHGATFSPLALLPVADDPIHGPLFAALGRRRNALLQRNNRRLAALLKRRFADDSLTKVKEYHHGCFFVLRPILDTIHDTTRYCRQLAAALQGAGIEARVAPSFGYDFVSITRVSGVQNATSALRVAMPDLPAELADRAATVIAAFAGPLSVD